MYEWRPKILLAEGENSEATGGSGASPPPPAPPPTGETPPAVTEQGVTEKTLLSEKPPEIQLFDPAKLQLPEGVKLEESVMIKFGEIAKSIPHETAQGLMNLYLEHQLAQEASNAQFWKDTQTKWESEVEADTEIGRENLGKVKETIGKVLANPELTDPKFRDALNFTGMGSNPAAIRTLYRWAQKLTEGTPTPTGNPPPNIAEKSGETRNAASILYPDLPEGRN